MQELRAGKDWRGNTRLSFFLSLYITKRLYMNEIKLLTPKDIQELFGIGKNNAYTLMHTPGFPSIIIGKRIYVEQEQLRNWLNTYSGRSFLI